MSKWNTVVRVLSLLIAISFFSSCTPRDVSVASDQDRAQWGRKSEKGGGGKSANTGATKDDMILASHLVERQAEALQMLSWVLDSSNFNKAADPSLKILESENTSNHLTQHFNFTSSKIKYLNYQATLSGSVHARSSWEAGAAGPSLIELNVTSLGFATFLQVNGGGHTLQAIDMQREMHVSPALGKPGEFDVVYNTVTRLKIVNGGNTDEREIYPQVEMRVHLDTVGKKVDVLSSVGNIRSYDRFMEQNIVSQDLKISFGPCVKIEGTVSVTSGKGPGELKVDENGFTSDAWKSAHAACEVRPVLDWRRFLEN
jgi:hypothetical protein